MVFLDEATPTQYRAIEMKVERDGEGGIKVTFEMALYNSEGRGLMHKTWATTLTQAQTDSFLAFYQNKMSEFETETGLVAKTASVTVWPRKVDLAAASSEKDPPRYGGLFYRHPYSYPIYYG